MVRRTVGRTTGGLPEKLFKGKLGAFVNHTCHHGECHRIFKERDDHLIDSDRPHKLVQIMSSETEDIFA